MLAVAGVSYAKYGLDLHFPAGSRTPGNIEPSNFWVLIYTGSLQILILRMIFIRSRLPESALRRQSHI